MRKICVAVLLVPALAWAQPKQAPKTAGEWYKEGENQYILGNFEKAVEAFKNGFTLETDEDKRSKYVFNIAQSYRQANDCAKAHFFYKRFLALKASPKAAPLDPQSRQQVEDRIKDLEACAQQAALISKRPPDSLPGDTEGDSKPPPSSEVRKETHEAARTEVAAPGNTAPGADEEERTDTGEPRPTGTRPHLISARITGGGTKFRMGPMVKVPVQAAFALTAGYPIAIDDRLTIDAGAVFTLTPVPYSLRQPMSTDETSKTALLTGVMANGAVSYEAAPRLSVRAALGEPGKG
jgi:hypothetical protein